PVVRAHTLDALGDVEHLVELALHPLDGGPVVGVLLFVLGDGGLPAFGEYFLRVGHVTEVARDVAQQRGVDAGVFDGLGHLLGCLWDTARTGGSGATSSSSGRGDLRLAAETGHIVFSLVDGGGNFLWLRQGFAGGAVFDGAPLCAARNVAVPVA